MPKEVIIIGAGGHAKVIADIVLKTGDWVVGFLDDDPTKKSVMGRNVLGEVRMAVKYRAETEFIIGVGDNLARRRIAAMLEPCELQWYTAVHPMAIVGAEVRFGKGTAVMAGAVVNPGASVGEHCIINSGAVIEHDASIGPFSHISPGAVLGGTVKLGALVQIGLSACVKNNLNVCGRVVVGMGGAVVKDIQEPGVYAGVPVRKLKEWTES